MLVIPPNDYLNFEGKLFREEGLTQSGLIWAFNILSLVVFGKIGRNIQN